MRILTTLVFSLMFVFAVQPASSDLLDTDNPQHRDILADLPFLDVSKLPGEAVELGETYKVFLDALVGARDAGTANKDAYTHANSAYSRYIASYDAVFKSLEEFAGDPDYTEIFRLINWRSAAFAKCAGFTKELLTAFPPASSDVSALEKYQPPTTMTDDLAECKRRLDAAINTIQKQIVTLTKEKAEATARIKQLKADREIAVAANDTKRITEIDRELKSLEEKIDDIEKTIVKATRVKAKLGLLKLLVGLITITAGIVYGFFTGDVPGAIAMIGVGTRTVVAALGTTRTETTEVKRKEPAPRPLGAEEKEASIRDAMTKKAEPLCCKATVSQRYQLVRTKETGAMSFGFENNPSGEVATIVLIENASGKIVAEINDDKLFFAAGPDQPPVSTTAFTSLDTAATIPAADSSHMVLFTGRLKGGGTASLAVAIHPLSHSGKFRVVVKPH